MSLARLPEPFTYFVDRSLGSKDVVEALRAAGEKVIAHAERFEDDTDDVVWLGAAGSARWVVLTKDARIRVNELERTALIEAGVAAFMLGRGDLTGKQMGAAFVAALPRIKKALRRFHPPFIASVSRDGAVSILIDAKDRLPSARPIK